MKNRLALSLVVVFCALVGEGCDALRVGDSMTADGEAVAFKNAAPNRQASDQKAKKFSGASVGTSRNLVANDEGVVSNWAGNTPPGTVTLTIDKNGMPVVTAETPSDLGIGEFAMEFGEGGKPKNVTVKDFSARKTDVINAGNAALAGWSQYIVQLPPNQLAAVKAAIDGGSAVFQVLATAVEAAATGGGSVAVKSALAATAAKSQADADAQAKALAALPGFLNTSPAAK